MKKINVTKTFLPPYEEYEFYLRKIWQSAHATNQGPLLKEFERTLGNYLGLKNIQLVSNGTIALQVALKALDISEGEVITTPFSYVATVSSILWERCQPVFVDIDPSTFCIDSSKIEAVITPRTKAIMPVHVFGNPCDIDVIDLIAKKHNLKVIYDGAHAFGVTVNGRSLLDYGDISTCSFHATKLFHTIEGGAIITRDDDLNSKIELIKRFGHEGDIHSRLGINAKASEFQAAMGLCNLKYVQENIKKRKKIAEQYDNLLKNKEPTLIVRPGVQHNYAYYPILLENEKEVARIIRKLNSKNIFPRRYFYPSLNTLPYLTGSRQNCPVAEDVAKRVICLPLYVGIEEDTINQICEVINQ